MEKQDMEQLVKLTDRLDADGHIVEAQALDAVLIKMAADEEKGLSNKASNALKSLHKACKSFCNKNLDSRGGSRRKLNKVCDMAEDLCDELEEYID